MTKKLVQLDHTYNTIRHVDSTSTEDFFAKVEQELHHDFGHADKDSGTTDKGSSYPDKDSSVADKDSDHRSYPDKDSSYADWPAAATPTRTAATPTRTAATPTRTAVTPTRAAATPTRTAATPTRTAATPKGTAATPTGTAATSTTTAATPTGTTATPTRPAAYPDQDSSYADQETHYFDMEPNITNNPNKNKRKMEEYSHDTTQISMGTCIDVDMGETTYTFEGYLDEARSFLRALLHEYQCLATIADQALQTTGGQFQVCDAEALFDGGECRYSDILGGDHFGEDMRSYSNGTMPT